MSDNGATIDDIIFGEFVDLNEAATVARLNEMINDKGLKASLDKVVLYAGEEGYLEALQLALVPLVEGRDSQGVETTLAAVKRYYYQEVVRVRVTSGRIERESARQQLIDLGEAIATSAIDYSMSQQRQSGGEIHRQTRMISR